MNLMHRLATVENPLDGIGPDFSIFGVEFNTVWAQIAALVWTAVFAIGVLAFLGSLGVLAAASASKNEANYAMGLKALRNSGLALAAVLLAGVIIGVIIAIFGQG